MTSLLEAQTKRIQELDELVVTLQKIKGGLLAELNDQRANVNMLQAEELLYCSKKSETLCATSSRDVLGYLKSHIGSFCNKS